jgi:hypothetical protein
LPALHLGIVVLRSTAAAAAVRFDQGERRPDARHRHRSPHDWIGGPTRRLCFSKGSAKSAPSQPDAAAGRGGGPDPARIHVFDCADVPALFERMFALRKELTGRPRWFMTGRSPRCSPPTKPA